MLLAIDIGNTNTVLGLFRDTELVIDWRIRTEQDMTTDEYGILIHNLFAARGVQFHEVAHMVISCVVPPMLNTVVEFAVKYFRIDAMGLDFLQNTYTARYRKSYGEITAFLSQSETPESAKATLERYSQHVEKYGRGTSRVIRDGTEFLLCNMGNEFDVVFHNGRLVGGVTMVSDKALAIRAAVDFRRLLHGQ